MIMKNDMVTLSHEEVEQLIEEECKRRLNMSTAEFLSRRRDGKLIQSAASTAIHDIEMLLKLA